MTQDEIIEMARQAGLPLSVNDITEKPYAKILESFAELVAVKEREACAKLIESHGETLANGAMLAEAIRAGKQAIAELERQKPVSNSAWTKKLSAAQRNELSQIEDGTWEADRNG